jgi:NTP pyrophosphatase (non-canonical NTP hydrolase)
MDLVKMMEENVVIDKIEFLRDELSLGEMLASLAEESAELAQAALKLRRAYDGSNPTPKSYLECLLNLEEEIGDVSNVISVLFWGDVIGDKAFFLANPEKITRWAERIKERNEAKKETVYAGNKG